MANNCSNSNTNSCSPCTGCEEVISSDCVSVLSSISCINMSSGDNLTDVLNALGSAVCNFYSLIDSGSGLTVSEVDGSPSYVYTNLLRFNQDSGFVVTQPGANTADVRLIPTFLFPDSNLVIVDAVTTANITLSGAQTIDTIVGVAGTTKVLVWKQTLKTENGIYIMQAGAWTRSTDSDTSVELNDQVAFANYTKTGTTYGGNYFNQIITSPTIGADNIIYQKGILGGNKLSWLVDGNETGAVKTMGSTDSFDVKFITSGNEIYRMFTTRQVGIGISASPLGKLHVMGTDTAILNQSILYLEDYAQTHSFEYRRDGSIYRNGVLHSLTTVNNNNNTSWGEQALENLDLRLAQGCTGIGHYALNTAVDTWDSTAVGDGAGEDAVGDDCCYFGKDAGKNNDGNYCIFIGSISDSSGTFNSSIAIGYNAEFFASNQFVLGAFDSPITEMYLGEGYKSSTPGNISLRGTVGNGSNISGGNFNIYPGVSTGTGITGDTVIYKAPSAGGSSSVLNSASETFKIKGTDGAIYRDTILYSVKPTPISNTSWGANALNITLSGVGNTAIGHQCGVPLTTGSYNTLLGYSSGTLLQTGSNNTLIGKLSGQQLVSGSDNTFIGKEAGISVTGSNNSGVGADVLSALTSGLYNAALGHGAGDTITNGSNNTFIGSGSGEDFNGASSSNVCVGFGSGNRISAAVVNYSTYIGNQTLSEQSYEVVIGGYDISFYYLGRGKYAGSADLNNILFQPNSPAATGSLSLTPLSNTNGINWTFGVSQPTGTGTAGDIILQYAPTVQGSGSVQNALATGITFKGIDGSLRASRRIEPAKGADIVAANDLTLGGDGNFFVITGNTTINAITITNWQAGSEITLMFTGTPTIKHNTAGGANTATMKLINGVDFTVSKNPTLLKLAYDGTNWQQVSPVSPNAV